MKSIFSFFIVTTFCLSINAHPWKAEQFIIIDTDGGLDDFRAINLMLASPEIRVLAIITTDGVLSAEETYWKVRALLMELKHEGILTAVYSSAGTEAKSCDAARNFRWGPSMPADENIPKADELIDYLNTNHKESISLVCLGGYNFSAHLVSSHAEFRNRIKRVIGLGDPFHPQKSFNLQLSLPAFSRLTEQAEFPVEIITPKSVDNIYTAELISNLQQIGNSYSENILRSLEAERLSFYDEYAALYLSHPDIFNVDSVSDITRQVKVLNFSGTEFLEMVTQEKADRRQVLLGIPADTSYYQQDVAKIVEEAISSYGKEEWNAGVLTNELHRHLGVYAIVGVKMGIRAKEYFGAGIDELKILSSAGQTPPFSCMNDGLQVSTGATLGHGLIAVRPDSIRLPMAEFTYMKNTISIRLKDEYRTQIESEVKSLKSIYGLNNDLYWELLRKKAIYIWLNWDRHTIFEIIEL